MNKIAIHQPCYLPYLGVFYKIWQSDEFVFLDDAQYSNGYVFDYNTIKTPQGTTRLKVPLHKSFGDNLIEVKPKYELKWEEKHINTIWHNYRKAPYFKELFPLLEHEILFHYNNLAFLNISLMILFMEWFGIEKPVYMASALNVGGKSEQRVIDIVRALNGDTYISGTGAKDYQNEENFDYYGIKLVYSDYKPKEYQQCWGGFHP